MNRLIPTIMGLLLVAIICILGCLGALFAEIAVASGPFTYLLSATVGSLLCALMTFFSASLAIGLFTNDELSVTDNRNNAISYAISGILFLASMTMSIVNFNGMGAKAVHLNENANTLQQAALAFFNKVDANHNGTITEQELIQALNTSVLNKEESRVAEDINNRRSEVGHVIDQQTHIIPSGKTIIVTTTYTYGVNAQDLETYPARIKDKYKHWMR